MITGLTELPTEMMVEKPDNFKHVPLPSEPAAQHRILESADLFRGTNEIMLSVFGCALRINQVPADGTPFILAHSAVSQR